MNSNCCQFLRVVAAFGALLAVPLAAVAQTSAPGAAASVLFSDGVVTSNGGGQGYRVIGKGSRLAEGETITTGERSFAIIEFADKSRTTLRPDTALNIEQFRYANVAESDGMLLRLLRGGVRAVTGLIGKARPEAVKFGTTNATIGIRGTQFDARICEGACASERHKTIGEPTAPVRVVVARVVLLKGPQAKVLGKDGSTRTLADGGAVYETDVVETGASTVVALAFNDNARVTINPSTRFEVVTWKFDRADKSKNNVFLKLLAGAVRVTTGLIGKTQPERVSVGVANSTIGIRGTGFDLHCTGSCAESQPLAGQSTPKSRCGSKAGDGAPPAAGEGLFVSTWDGTVSVGTGACTVRVARGQSLYVDQKSGESRYLPRVPSFMNDDAAERPDRIEVDPARLFGAEAPMPDANGLYTYVRDGHILVQQGGAGIDLTAGEAGFADAQGRPPVRLSAVPEFIADDPYPLPETFNERGGNLLQLLRENAGGLAGGAPGQCFIQ